MIELLLDFTVSNYRSIRDECTLSMEAYTKDRRNKESLIKNGKEVCLPTVGIFGANASGKSAVIEAIDFLRKMVLDSGNYSEKKPISCPGFAFCDNAKPRSSEFKIRFISNGMEYAYSFSVLEDHIEEETLRCKSKIVFRRSGQKIDFPNTSKTDRARMEMIKDLVNPNSLFLSKCSQFQIPVTKIPFDWIADSLVIVNSQTHASNEKILELKEEVVKMLSAADIGISDIREIEKGLRIRSAGTDIVTVKMLGITHIIRGSEGERTHELSEDEESDGTIRLLSLIPYWLDALKKGKAVIIDEIEKHLHPAIVDYLISLFTNPADNANGAQLIFTTHDAAIPDRTNMRRDQIWLTARDPNIGATSLYSLLDFNVRSDLRFTANYLAGRFGAVPVIDRSRNGGRINGEKEKSV
ncbi:ATP-binding protein [Methanomassiliicoccales archaeon LGM-DZ1]|nr:ATP-binding protein [Methanomassiliicoccales archaeon LGM-DZ1]